MTSSMSTSTGTRRAIIGVVVAALAFAVPAGSQAATTPGLIASVGPGYTISLKTTAGRKVRTLQRGTYAITVRDRSRQHDFRLRGPGLSRVLSSVAAVGTKTVTVRLGAGTYEFLCQPHASAMRGAFSAR